MESCWVVGSWASGSWGDGTWIGMGSQVTAYYNIAQFPLGALWV